MTSRQRQTRVVEGGRKWIVFLLGAATAVLLVQCSAKAAVRILEISPPGQINKGGKLEIGFAIEDSAATNNFWPYDPLPPAGVAPATGISVEAVFTDPLGKQHRQPAFYYQRFLDEFRNGREWVYPTDEFEWKVRFTPHLAGTWKYRLVARDRSGTAESPVRNFTVAPSVSRGFVRVSAADPRYFEFEDGTFFPGLGLNLEAFLNGPLTRGKPEFDRLAANGITFVRMWISSLFGSAWTPYVGARNRYNGYLPVTGLMPVVDGKSGDGNLTMRIDYELSGDSGWFDACRFGWSDDPEAIKPATPYRIRVEYRGVGIQGPRRPGLDYGLVVKLGGMHPNCYEPGTSRPVTNYGKDSAPWGYIEGSWTSGNAGFLPRMYLAMENVSRGAAYIREISLREDLGGGRFGPEVMTRPSMDHQIYVPQKEAHALDKVVELAGRSGVYLKLVIMDKSDEIYVKIADDGTFAVKQDNETGFYGTGRNVNKTRWLQQAWWRYLQARWGYSPNVHSWELTNEGDPASVRHFEMADEFGKYMHCRVFGVEPGVGDGARCTYEHPNRHLVTTSFWHSFPAKEFWSNTRYPNVDYADLHAYISTSPAGSPEKREMASDAAQFHLWHSRFAALFSTGKPVVRGEAGLDAPGQQNEFALGVHRDRAGVWLHNFLWACLDSGGLYELYWWKSHIWNDRGDLRGAYRLPSAFLAGLPLNKGGYTDWGGNEGSPDLRVVGQKNPGAGALHLWIQNRNHTWKNSTEGRAIDPVDGDVTIPGFSPGRLFLVEWWDTYATEKSITRSDEIRADRRGVLTIPVRALATDVALTARSK
jgi:hypothetical protein